VRSIKVALPVKHDLPIESSRLITRQIENQILRLCRDLKPTVIEKILRLVVVEDERSQTER
jgi:hypothetical protein